MRGLERAQTKWLVLAGALVGFGFITKMMQAFLILPVMAVVYLLAAPTGWWRRVWQVVLMGVSVVVAAGWWVAAVALTPAADRPYVGGSQDNNIFNLIFGYNGFGRLTGNEAGSVGGGRVAGSMWGPTGLTRLFNSEFGNMMSWLLPGALVMGAVLLVLTLRARRTDRERAALLLWGGSLVCTGLVISLAQGIIHPYYTVALAPPLGGLVGIATMGLWQRRGTWAGRVGLAAGLARHGGLGLRPARAARRTGSPRCGPSWRWPAPSASLPSWLSRCCAPSPSWPSASSPRSASVPRWPRPCSRRSPRRPRRTAGRSLGDADARRAASAAPAAGSPAAVSPVPGACTAAFAGGGSPVGRRPGRRRLPRRAASPAPARVPGTGGFPGAAAPSFGARRWSPGVPSAVGAVAAGF